MFAIGTTGTGSSSLFSSGSTTATSATVSNLPAGATLYATLSSEIGGVWQTANYSYIEAQTAGSSPAAVVALSCSATSITGAGTDACAITLAAPAAAGGQQVMLTSSAAAVAVPAKVTVAANSTSVAFTATAAAVTTLETATLTASAGGGSMTENLQLNAAVPILTLGRTAINFGNVPVNTVSSQSEALKSTGTFPLTITSITAFGAGFTVSGPTLPATVAPGTGIIFVINLHPTVAGPALGTVTVNTNSSTGAAATVSVYGVGAAALGGLTCSTSTMTGVGTDVCAATLSAAAPTGGATVTLSSNNAAVTVPGSIFIPAGAAGASFTATASSVGAAQSATLSASQGGVSATFAVQLNAATRGLTLSAASIFFGTVAVNSSASQSISLTSTGSMPVTVSSAAAIGAGFTITGGTFPATLNPGQTSTLTVLFNPVSSGEVSGTLTIASNSTSGSTTTASLSGTGMPVTTSLTCGNASMTGAGSDVCTVTLNSAAPTGGTSVTLTSCDSAVTVPGSVTVAAGATSAAFTATVTSVSTAQSATLTAASGSSSMTFTVQLNAGTSTLGLSAASISFGSVTVDWPTTQTLTLSSTGNVAVTITSAGLTGSGFSMGAATFPMTLNPGQTATMELEFDPTTAGAATGQLTLASSSSGGSTAVVNLSGSANAMLYNVSLNWEEPTDTTGTIAGFNVYRASSGSTMYQMVSTTMAKGTSFVDSTVQNGDSYDYYVETVDTAGLASVPSSVVAMAIPN